MAETLRIPSTWTPAKLISQPERHAREDRQLVRGVDAVDVEAGVGLA